MLKFGQNILALKNMETICCHNSKVPDMPEECFLQLKCGATLLHAKLPWRVGKV